MPVCLTARFMVELEILLEPSLQFTHTEQFPRTGLQTGRQRKCWKGGRRRKEGRRKDRETGGKKRKESKGDTVRAHAVKGDGK